ncbi:MAG: dTDP-glucose 4,6-dehydratase [Planctomycetes bacterium]|nr:dTDP-glucose 4,6-dehydratase [Planctomycetota bacterium]
MGTILVTGGAGFIGSNWIRQRRDRVPGERLVNVDLLTYAGNLENLSDLAEGPDYRFVRADIVDRAAMRQVFESESIDRVVHFAAESHVDRSIEDAGAFLSTNVIGTQVLIDLAREFGVDRYVQVSTDEVYGSLGDDGLFTESTPLAPNSPYSASKASGDMLVRAAVETHRFPGIITRCSNNYGPYQFPEKLIPLMIANALDERPLPVYGDGMNVRDWLYVSDHCEAIDTVLRRGEPGQVYNVGGHNEMENIAIVKLLLGLVGKDESLITYVQDRPGHDRRYAIDASFIQQELGWTPAHRFEDGIRATVAWYLEHREWMERCRSGAYRAYYDAMYGADGRHGA